MLYDLPSSVGTTREGPDLIGLSATSAAGICQKPSSILVVATIDIQALVRGTVHNIASRRYAPLL